MNEKLSITLPAEVIAEINLQVETGRYASTSEFLREATEAFLRDESDLENRLAVMRAGVASSMADPRPMLTGDQVKARLDARAARLRGEG